MSLSISASCENKRYVKSYVKLMPGHGFKVDWDYKENDKYNWIYVFEIVASCCYDR